MKSTMGTSPAMSIRALLVLALSVAFALNTRVRALAQFEALAAMGNRCSAVEPDKDAELEVEHIVVPDPESVSHQSGCYHRGYERLGGYVWSSMRAPYLSYIYTNKFHFCVLLPHS